VPQKQHEENYLRMIGGQVRIWPDMLFPAGQKKECMWEWGPE
jgi:hypothetical protein